MNFAVIENNNIINIVTADSKEIAEAATNKTCVQYADGELVYIGGLYDGVRLMPPKPFPSFIYNVVTKNWESSIPMPSDGKNYRWVEDTLSWEIFVDEKPYPSWILNEETSFWEAPVENSLDPLRSKWDEDSLSWVVC